MLTFFPVVLCREEDCTRNDKGKDHRLMMGLSKLHGLFGPLAMAVVGGTVMQVPTATNFAHVVIIMAAAIPYIVGMGVNCALLYKPADVVIHVALAQLFFAFITHNIHK